MNVSLMRTMHQYLRARTEAQGTATGASKTIRLTLARKVLVISVVAVAATAFFAAAFAFHLFAPPTNCWIRPVDSPNTAIFTIVMADQGVNVGFNGSAYHSAPWPVMNVTLRENVLIHVINNDSAQAHGFQITHYFDQGIGQAGLAPGKCYDVRFIADQAGSFQVFCNIFCTIHLLMQDGRLNVK